MPWFINLSRRTLPVTLADGTAFRFAPHEEIFIESNMVSAELADMVERNAICLRHKVEKIQELIVESAAPVSVEPSVEVVSPVLVGTEEIKKDEPVQDGMKSDTSSDLHIQHATVALSIVTPLIEETDKIFLQKTDVELVAVAELSDSVDPTKIITKKKR